MGGGNANKSMNARAKKEAEKAKASKSSIKDNAKYQADMKAFKCVACFTNFPTTCKEKERREHVENKHPKKKYEECFKE